MAGTNPGGFTVGGVHINAPLSQLSIGYHPTGMIAEQVFPVMKVAHESDLYYKWDKGQAFRVERSDGYGTLRADKTLAKQFNYAATVDSYLAQEFAAEITVSDREVANADAALQLQLSKVRRVQDMVLLDQEIRIASILTSASTYAAANKITLSGTSQWNNASFASQTNGQHSVIVQEILAGKDAVRKATGGLLPNTIIIPFSVAMVMGNDVGLVDALKYTHSDLLVANLLPSSLLGMQVLIPTAEYQANNEGEAFAGSDVWGKNVLMLYVNPQPGLDALTTGMIFRNREWQVKQYRDETRDTTVYRPSLVQAEKLVTADCAYAIFAAIA